jgi:hypothetical protein
VASDYYAVAHVQAEASTLAYVLCGEEGLEDTVSDLLGYSWAVVRDLHEQSVTLVGRAQPYAADLVPIGDGVYGVVYEVSPDLVELAAVGCDAGQALVIVALDLDVL